MPVLQSNAPQVPRERRNKVRSPEVGEKGGPQEPTKKPRAAVQFGVPGAKPVAPITPAPITPAAEAKPATPPRPKERVDPKLVVAARELRDRYLEQVNGGRHRLESIGRYDVARTLADQSAIRNPQPAARLSLPKSIALLPAA